MSFRLPVAVAFCMAVAPSYAALHCPDSPRTEVSKDVKSDIDARVGSLGRVKAAQIEMKTEVVSKNLFEKYPNIDRLVAIQLMSATYCNILNNSTSVSDSEKLNRWEKFQDKVFTLIAK